MAQSIKINVADNGLMVLPRAVRDLLGLKEAGVVHLSIDGDEIKFDSFQTRVKRAQALYRASAAHDFTSDNFLRERKLEAEREHLKDQKYFENCDK